MTTSSESPATTSTSKAATATSTASATTASAAAPVIASTLSAEERDAIARMSYEEARDRLIAAVQKLEAGGLSLEQSMRQWEYGEALAQRAQELLQDVREKLTQAQNARQSTANTAGTQSNLEA